MGLVKGQMQTLVYEYNFADDGGAIGAITYLLDRPGARFSKVPVIIEPVKLLSFTKFQ